MASRSSISSWILMHQTWMIALKRKCSLHLGLLICRPFQANRCLFSMTQMASMGPGSGRLDKRILMMMESSISSLWTTSSRYSRICELRCMIPVALRTKSVAWTYLSFIILVDLISRWAVLYPISRNSMKDVFLEVRLAKRNL